MTLAYGVAFLGDILLYLGGLGCLGLLSGCTGALALVPPVLLAACWLSGRLTGRGRPWLRWLPMAASVPALILAGNAAGRWATLPMLVYLALYVYNNRRAPDYDGAADRFRHSLIVMGILLAFAAVVRSGSWTQGLPWLFLYFTLNVTLLRLLRHDDAIARSRRFRLLNLASVALVCGVGFALSQPGIIAALKRGWLWLADNVLLRLLALILYLLQWALFLVGRLILALFPNLGEADLSAIPPMAAPPGGEQLAPVTPEEIRALPAPLLLMLRVVGFAILAALIFLILRAVARRTARVQSASGTDVREPLDAPEPRRPRALARRRDPGDGLRRRYRQALALLRNRGGRVTPFMNTQQILEENAALADPDAHRALREIYLPARYGDRSPTREDERRAKEALERMRGK